MKTRSLPRRRPEAKPKNTPDDQLHKAIEVLKEPDELANHSRSDSHRAPQGARFFLRLLFHLEIGHPRLQTQSSLIGSDYQSE